MKRNLLTLTALLVLITAVLADDKPKSEEKPKTGTPVEIQDMIFFGAKRPVLIRLHLYIDGEALGTFWEKVVQKRFDFADRNKDKTLSEKELKYFPLPSSNPYAYYYGQVQGGQPTMSEVDSDSDGSATMPEMLAYLRKKGISPVQLSGAGINTGGQMMGQPQQPQYYNPNQNAQSSANQLTEALFKRLDTNKDGKLSKEELQVGEKKLIDLDGDDDETVDMAELLQQNPYNPYGYQIPVKQPDAMMRPDKNDVTKDNGNSFVLVPREDGASNLTMRMAMTKEMMARYDKDKSGKVTREEIGFPKEIFEQLDKNTDDVLDQFELLRWVLVAPDVELVVKLGKVEGKEYAVDFAREKGRLSDQVSRTTSRGMALVLEGTQIEVLQQQSLYGYGQNVTQQNFLVQQFKALDQQAKKGYIDKKMLQQPQYRIFQAIFDAADTDENGQLTEKELQAYGDLQSDNSRSMLSINVSEVGRALFSYLDANKDNRLSRREMMEFADRLAVLDPDKTGTIKKESIPYQFRATVSLGAAQYQQYYDPNQQMQQQRPASTSGPTWFRKMDANNDGDVSRREFLGSPKDFAGIDTNSDGIISLSEAEAADSRLRSKN